MSAVMQELLKATKQKAKGPKEVEQKFLERVAKSLDTLSDPDYEKLSASAKAWHEAAVEAVKDGKDLPAFPSDAKPAAGKGKKDAPAPKPATPPAAAKKGAAKKKATTAPAAPKKPKEPKEKKERGPRSDEPRESSAADMTKYLVCKNSKATVEQVMEQLKAKKVVFSEDLVKVEYIRTQRCIQFLGALGKLK